MASNFGFKAVSAPYKHSFVSYSRGDTNRLAPIVRLVSRELPVWYDAGLPYGKNWEHKIIKQIDLCRIAVFFASKDLFERLDTYMYDEYLFVNQAQKPCLCVWLDDMRGFDPGRLNNRMHELWDCLNQMESTAAYEQPTVEAKAKAVIVGIQRALLNQTPNTPSHTSHSQTSAQSASQTRATPKAEAKAENFHSLQDGPLSGSANTAGKAAGLSAAKKVAAAAIAGTIMATSTAALVININTEPERPENTADSRYVQNIGSVDDLDLGDIVIMGTYEKKEMEWRVIDKQNDDVLLVSEHVLTQQPFDSKYTLGHFTAEVLEKLNESHKKQTVLRQKPYQYSVEYTYNVNWESGSLRTWLNGHFLSRSFNKTEQGMMKDTTAKAQDVNVKPLDVSVKRLKTYTISGGNDTVDKIFLLSADECQQYFPTDSARRATDLSGKSCGWWLRTSGYSYLHGYTEKRTTSYRYQYNFYKEAPPSGASSKSVVIGGTKYEYDNKVETSDSVYYYKDGALVGGEDYDSKETTATGTIYYWSGSEVARDYTGDDEEISAAKSLSESAVSKKKEGVSTVSDSDTKEEEKSVTRTPVYSTDTTEYEEVDDRYIQTVGKDGSFPETEESGSGVSGTYQCVVGQNCFEDYGVRPAVWVHIGN